MRRSLEAPFHRIADDPVAWFAVKTSVAPLAVALERTLNSFAAILHGYKLEVDQEVHAVRMLRSVLHGFATLEVNKGFQMSADVDDSFAWMVAFINGGLRAAERTDLSG